MTKRKTNPAPPNAAEAGIVTQPSTHAVIDWSPDRITLAEHTANTGNFTLLADLCESMMADDRISQALDRLFDSTTLPLTFQLPGKKAEDSKNDPIVQALDADWWHILPESTVRDIVGWLALAWVCLVHIDGWVQDPESGRVIPKLTVWSLRNLRHDPERGWVVKVATSGSPLSFWKEISIEPGDGNWMILSLGSGWRSVMRAPWRGLARWWLLKVYATVDWAAASERHGQGIGVASNTSESFRYQEKDREKLARQIAQGGRNKTIVLPDGFEYSLIVDGANTYTTFKVQTETANLAFSISLIGTNLTTEVQGGSYAAAGVHKSADASKVRGLLESLSTSSRSQLLIWWVLYNWGAGSLAPYPHWDTTPPEDLDALAGTQVKASTAAKQWVDAGFPVSRSKWAEKWGVPLAETPEDTLQPRSNPTTDEGAYRGPSEKADKAKPTAQLRARAQAQAIQAPADTFSRGLDYVSRLEESTRRHAAKELAPTLASVLAAIERSESYEEAKQAVLEAYQDRAPVSQLCRLTEAMMLMAQLAGAEAVRQEALEDIDNED